MINKFSNVISKGYYPFQCFATDKNARLRDCADHPEKILSIFF